MNNNINYGNLVADFPLGGSSSLLFSRSNWNLEN